MGSGFVIMIVSTRYEQLPGVTRKSSILAMWCQPQGKLTSKVLGVFFATAGLYPISPAATAWIALNCAGSMKRAVGIGAMISLSQLGGVSWPDWLGLQKQC